MTSPSVHAAQGGRTIRAASAPPPSISVSPGLETRNPTSFPEEVHALLTRASARASARRMPVASAASAPSHPVSEANTETKTASVAAKLRSAAGVAADARTKDLLGHHAGLLERCLPGARHRCGSWACPRCQVKRAKEHGRTAEKHLRGVFQRGSMLGFLTVTVPADDLARGFDVLGGALTDLLRSRAWSKAGIVGGTVHVELKPASATAGRSWLVHAHAVVEVAISPEVAASAGFAFDDTGDGWFAALFGPLIFHMQIDFESLRSTWDRLVRKHSKTLLVGRLDLRAAQPEWTELRSSAVVSRLARYVTKRCRGELATYTADQLAALAVFHRQGRPRLARGSFGCWRKSYSHHKEVRP